MKEKRWKFEYWIRHTLPEQLYLSCAKKAAMDSVFYHFSDLVEPLEKKAPLEFAKFFNQLTKLVEEVSEKRTPKNYFAYKGSYHKKPNIDEEQK